MSDHLDSNYKNWPEDPFELLNVDENSDKKSIRRAYNRLIKKFKPDHNPEEFHLIRTAYEAALNHIEFSIYFSEPLDEEVEIDDIQSSPDFSVKVVKETKGDDISWQKACAGSFEEGFNGLRVFAESTYEPEAVLRLYWLKKIKKDLADIDTLSILCGSYEKFQNYKISTLIFKEMEKNISWTLSLKCIVFIENVSKNSPENIRLVLEKRWQLAYENQALEIISSDLERLRPNFTLKEEEWGVILLSAHNFLSFWVDDEAEEALKKYHSEVNKLPVNVGGYLDTALDSYDLLREVRRIIRNDQNGFIDNKWKKIISAYWAGSEKTLKSLLDEKLLSWVKDPDSTLLLFDGMNTKAKPIIIAQVKKIVNSYAYSINPDIYQIDESKIDARIKKFLENKKNLGYFSERKNILHFCIYQDVPPDLLVSYVMKNELENLYWIQAVNKDIHSCVYLIYKALMYLSLN